MPVPYYPGSLVTPNFGLSLVGMEVELAQNFIIIDSALGGGGGGSSVQVNGVDITDPNFNDTTPAAPVDSINVLWQVDGSGNVSAYVPVSGVGNLTGTLTPGIIPFATGAHALSDGSITDNGGGLLGAAPSTFGVLVFAGFGSFGADVNDSIGFTVEQGPFTAAANGGNMSLQTGGVNGGDVNINAQGQAGGNVSINAINDIFILNANGLTWQGVISGQAGIQVAAAAGTPHPLQLPMTTGASGAVLSTDGNNPQQLSWITPNAGTVTTFSAGALSPLFTTSVATATTTPALTFSLSTQTANTVFAGPTSGAAAGPTFRTLVTADMPAGTNVWSSLQNAAADLILANSAFNTTFGQTSSAVVWKWWNTTAATTSTAASSPNLSLSGGYFSNNATASDDWVFQNILANPLVQTITNISENVSSVVTLTMTAAIGANLLAGDLITLSGLTTGTWLNGKTVTITTATGTGTTSITFTDPTGHGTQASHAETGTITQVNQNSILNITHAGLPGNLLHSTTLGGVTTNAQINGVMVPNLWLANGSSGIMHAAGSGGGPPTINSYGWFPGVAQGSLSINCRNNSTSGLTVANLGVVGFNLNSTPGIVTTYNAKTTASVGLAAVYGTVSLTAQAASIGTTTAYAVPAAGTGMYRLSYYMKVTQAATTSGSVTLTLGWTDKDDSTALTITIPTPANSTTISGVVSGVLIVDAKVSTNITYSTTYASVGATGLAYKLKIEVEAI